MPINFAPVYNITNTITKCLMRIEAAKVKTLHLPLTPRVLKSLRETARLYTTHYSTMIEGNRLEPDEVRKVLTTNKGFPGRERDQDEVKGYFAALREVEQWAAQNISISEQTIQSLHALIMGAGRLKVKPTPYRTGQNAIRDSSAHTIVYMPPEAKDVPKLMKEFVYWINKTRDLPCPIVAAIVHYQFATIHPYYDGNGRTARLLTTLVLHLGGYDLKGLYSLEEHYANNLQAYYNAIARGGSHNYYLGRAEADITEWLEYFMEGMTIAFEKVVKRMSEAGARKEIDHANSFRKLDPKQRRALELFQEFEIVSAKQIGELFGLKSRSSSQLCKNWVEDGFLKIVDYSKKGRKYQLAKMYEHFVG